MRLADGMFVAVRDGVLVLGHADRPFQLWQIDPGLMIVLAEIARGTSTDDLVARPESTVTLDPAALRDTLRTFDAAGLLTDVPGAALRDVNLEIAKVVSAAPDLADDAGFRRATQATQGLTLTSAAAQYALWTAVRYVVAAGVPGAAVECGVWRGGSMVLTASALLEAGDRDRELYLFDTFGWVWDQAADSDGFIGLPGPAPDASGVGVDQMAVGTSSADVFRRVSDTGYPPELIRCVAGLVQDTLAGRAPERIAVLRLDTDQYESTLHELRTLYPRVSPGGVVIVDDYGKLSGATRATDEYLAEIGHAVLLHRIDTQGRLFVKPHDNTAPSSKDAATASRERTNR